VSNINFDIWIWVGGLYKYTMKNSKHQSSCSLGVQIKGIAQTFNWRKFLGGILPLIVHSRVSNNNIISINQNNNKSKMYL
jgi:hypothetical protein